MASGAVLTFDHETEAAIRGLWQTMEDAGLPSKMMHLNYPPHLTVITGEDTDVDGLEHVLREAAAGLAPVEVSFHSLGVFNSADGVIYLAPVVTAPLLELHAALWEVFVPFVREPSGLYSPGSWVPHVTLNVEVPADQVGDVMEVLLRAGLPRSGVLNTLFVADFDHEKPDFQEMLKLRLGG